MPLESGVYAFHINITCVKYMCAVDSKCYMHIVVCVRACVYDSVSVCACVSAVHAQWWIVLKQHARCNEWMGRRYFTIIRSKERVLEG